jgi:hypothetical protein
MNFAEEAVRIFELRKPECIVTCLFRVDIMQLADGSLVVNEFESLEAGYGSNEKNEMQTQIFLYNFWLRELRKLEVEK